MTRRGRRPAAACLGAAVVLIALAAAGAAAAETVTGWVYAMPPQPRVVLFRWAFERDQAGHRWRSRYWTPGGELAAEDEVVWEGATFATYRYWRPSVDEIASVERRGEVLSYRQVVRGRVRESQEPFESPADPGPAQRAVPVTSHGRRLP